MKSTELPIYNIMIDQHPELKDIEDGTLFCQKLCEFPELPGLGAWDLLNIGEIANGYADAWNHNEPAYRHIGGGWVGYDDMEPDEDVEVLPIIEDGETVALVVHDLAVDMDTLYLGCYAKSDEMDNIIICDADDPDADYRWRAVYNTAWHRKIEDDVKSGKFAEIVRRTVYPYKKLIDDAGRWFAVDRVEESD